ncbi:unnamed protein product, partial [Lymnaea stagnalis]
MKLFKMSSKTEQNQRFVKFINQQLMVLKEEGNTIKMAADDCINKVQSEVDYCVNGGKVSQATCEEISNKIHHAITFFIAKSVELSCLRDDEGDHGHNLSSSAHAMDSSSTTTTHKLDAQHSSNMLSSREVADEAKGQNASEADTSHILTMRLDLLEKAVLSLKKSAEQVQEQQ